MFVVSQDAQEHARINSLWPRNSYNTFIAVVYNSQTNAWNDCISFINSKHVFGYQYLKYLEKMLHVVLLDCKERKLLNLENNLWQEGYLEVDKIDLVRNHQLGIGVSLIDNSIIVYEFVGQSPRF